MNDYELRPLRDAIKQFDMLKIWGESIHDLTAPQQEARAMKRRLEAEGTFLKLIRSSENPGGKVYEDWAVRKALGLRSSKRHTAQATGGKNWQAWAPKETPGE